MASVTGVSAASLAARASIAARYRGSSLARAGDIIVAPSRSAPSLTDAGAEPLPRPELGASPFDGATPFAWRMYASMSVYASLLTEPMPRGGIVVRIFSASAVRERSRQ